MDTETTKLGRRAPTIQVLKCDLARAQRLADAGTISQASVRECAGVYTTMRRFQKANGPGHKPLDAVADMLPQTYVHNWALKRLSAA